MRITRFLNTLLLAATLIAALPPMAQARPQHILSHYNHRSWRLVDGAPPDIWALAQSPDGFLWLGTGAGLYRFDGVTFETVVPRIGRFPSRNITALLATPDGTIWIGYSSGDISRLRGGRLDNFRHADATVEQLARERDGTIWAAKTGRGGGLFRFAGERWTRVGTIDGVHDTSVYSVLAARDGAMWAATGQYILARRPGTRRFAAVRPNSGVSRLAQAPDDQVWASGNFDAAAQTAHSGSSLAIMPLPPGAREAISDRAIFDRSGTLWETAFGGGVVQVTGLSATARAAPQFDRFTSADGLTSPIAVPLLEDREGNIWIGTNLGLDRLRPVSAVVALSLPPEARGGFEIVATAEGAVYVSQSRRLYRALPGTDLKFLRVLPGPITLLEAEGRDLIIGQSDAVLRLRGNALTRVDVPRAPGDITSWTRDPSGHIWISTAEHGVFELTQRSWRSTRVDGQLTAPSTMHTPSGLGGTWLFAGDRLLRRSSGQISAISGDLAPRVGQIAIISSGPAGTLVGGDLGLARLEAGRFRTLDQRSATEVSGISGIVQTDDGTVWINGIHGLVQTHRSHLDAAFADSRAPLRYQMFGAADGLPGVAQQDERKSTVVRGGDGRIWVADNVGVGWIDPARLIRNPLPPPVVIRDLTANGRTFVDPARVSLPARTQNLRIRYTALSLAAPERVRFRYRLIGVDRDWVDAGARREAFYAHVPPGQWRFQVIAANNDGVWNTQGGSLAVSIAPMYYQTWWFRLLCVGTLLLTGWLIYVWRMREHMARARARAEAQIGERERIARELHDTLLQGVQGLILHFQAAASATTLGSRAHDLMETALERADDVIIQARDRVRALRTITQASSLAPHLERIAARYRNDGLSISIAREGAAMPLAGEQIEELVAIVEEAFSNVLRHARASRVELTLLHAPKTLSIRIADDGVGMPAELVRAGEKAGHFGLLGMRERVVAMSGNFQIVSPPQGGTMLSVTIPVDPGPIRRTTLKGRTRRPQPVLR